MEKEIIFTDENSTEYTVEFDEEWLEECRGWAEYKASGYECY